MVGVRTCRPRPVRHFFLHDRFPALAAVVAREIVAKTRLLADNPQIGHSIAGRSQLRQVVLQVLNAAYVLQYRIDGDRIVILRVFHGREQRGPGSSAPPQRCTSASRMPSAMNIAPMAPSIQR